MWIQSITSKKTTNTKSRLLELLQRERAATIEILSKALGLAPATVRRHLDVLQRDGLVSYEEVRGGAGRPYYLFSLTDEGHEVFPTGYARLANLILQELRSLRLEETQNLSGEGLSKALFLSIADRMVSSHSKELEGKSLEEQIGEVVEVLNAEGFPSDWDKTPEGYRIVSYSCPFLHVTEANPQPCLMHYTFIQKLLKTEVQCVERVVEGGHCCSYVIPSPSTALSRESSVASS